MLGSFNSMFSKLKSVNLVSTVTDNYNKLKDKMLNKLTITRIIPQLFHIDYPQENNVEQLIAHISFSPYQIWNISEYRYEDRFQNIMKEKAPFGQICFLYYEYFSNIPFYDLVQAIGKIKQFISANPAHRVYVHCQDSKVRSAVFLAAYLFQTTAVQDISEAILYVNQHLEMQLEEGKQGASSCYKNNHRLFKNLVNYHNDVRFINPWRLKLQKIIITNAPKINIQEGSEKGELKIVIELRDAESVLFKGTFPEAVIEGDCIGLSFYGKGKELVVNDEFLLMVKYSWNKKIYSILRIQLNTNFIFQLFARIQQQDIDLSVHCADSEMGSATSVDLMFEEEKEKSKLAVLSEKVAERRLKRELKKQENVDLLAGEGVMRTQQPTIKNVLPVQQQIVMPVVEATKAELYQLNFEINQMQMNEGNQLSGTGKQLMGLNEKELSLRIETMKDTPKIKVEHEQEQEEEDLDDYFSKLQSLA